MEIGWDLGKDSFSNLVNNAQRAEKNGFDSVLLINLNDVYDPWIVASHIAAQTSSINMLAAQNTSYYLPTVSAKAASTLYELTKRHIDLNLVSGSSPIEINRNVTAGDHTSRYRRTREFAKILRLLRENKKISYTGEFFSVTNSVLYPPSCSHPRIFISGSSENACDTAAQFADYYMMFADYPKKVGQQVEKCRTLAREYNNRKLGCGLIIDVIARRTSAESWDIAEKIYNAMTEEQKRSKQLFSIFTDAKGIQNHKNFQLQVTASDLKQETLWPGRSLVSHDHGLSIVGDYKEVIHTIKQYEDSGINYFIFTGSGDRNEIERIGQYIIPYIR